MFSLSESQTNIVLFVANGWMEPLVFLKCFGIKQAIRCNGKEGMADKLLIDIPDFELTDEQKKNAHRGAIEATNEEYLKKLAYQHNIENNHKDSDIVEAFPEEQSVVVEKLNEYWEEAARLYRKMIETRNIVDQTQADPFSKWFFINAEKYKDGIRLKEVYGHIKRLRRLKVAYEKKQIEGLLKFAGFETKTEAKRYNTDAMMERDNLLVDIVIADGIQLRGTSSRFQGLCPFHQERTPSFSVYSDNWFHCFGCQKHGNVFNYVMTTRQIEFKQSLAEVDRFM